MDSQTKQVSEYASRMDDYDKKFEENSRKFGTLLAVSVSPDGPRAATVTMTRQLRAAWLAQNQVTSSRIGWDGILITTLDVIVTLALSSSN